MTEFHPIEPCLVKPSFILSKWEEEKLLECIEWIKNREDPLKIWDMLLHIGSAEQLKNLAYERNFEDLNHWITWNRCPI